MTIAYFDCFSGISGDMTLGALIDAGADATVLDAVVEALGLGREVEIQVRHELRGHAGGTRVVVREQAGARRTVPQMREAVQSAPFLAPVAGRALDAIDRLARAEMRLHGVPEDRVHLHELGRADTLVDVAGAFALLDSLGVASVYSSPLPAPSGRLDGMPLPAPASMKVLEGTGAVIRPVDVDRELVTPTGAAILAAARARFERPAVSLRSIGYGVGARDVAGNSLAVWIGEEVRDGLAVTEIETNLDDMPPNAIAALVDDLMAAGALDVTVTAILMKKGRPGHALAVMAPRDLVAKLTDHLLRHSTTLGVRLKALDRVTAGRRLIEVSTRFGVARAKVKELGGRAIDVAPEFEDCRRLSTGSGSDLAEVMRAVSDAARRELGLE